MEMGFGPQSAGLTAGPLLAAQEERRNRSFAEEPADALRLSAAVGLSLYN